MMFKSQMKQTPHPPTPRWLPPGLQITCHVEVPLPPPLRGWSVSGRHAYSPGLLKNARMLECSWERQGALRGVWVFHCVTIPRWGKISAAKRQRWLFLFVSLLGLMRKCGPRCFCNSAALILEKQKRRFSSANSWYLTPLMSREKGSLKGWLVKQIGWNTLTSQLQVCPKGALLHRCYLIHSVGYR